MKGTFKTKKKVEQYLELNTKSAEILWRCGVRDQPSFISFLKNIFCLIRRVIGSEFHRCVVVAEERGVDTAQFSSSMWEHLQRSWVSCASFRVLAPCNP